ncbi:MAG: hypothetical protein G01um101419_785 [Parcubacteria group bacterium Gr01-1014_19]|nr:MAG: hypothetical protein G01um101419_785 [Parcubacteria group bacterium Gr01-1014_19]
MNPRIVICLIDPMFPNRPPPVRVVREYRKDATEADHCEIPSQEMDSAMDEFMQLVLDKGMYFLGNSRFEVQIFFWCTRNASFKVHPGILLFIERNKLSLEISLND